MLAILNLFWNLVFYVSFLRMLFLASNFVYESCRELAALHQREKVEPSTSREISTASQTARCCNPHQTARKPPSPSKPVSSRGISTASQTARRCNHHQTARCCNPLFTARKPPSSSKPVSSKLVIDKYPHQQLNEAENEFCEVNEENCDFEETNSWCQCSCVIS